VKDKETATKIASDAASTSTPTQPSADGEPQNSASDTAQAQVSTSVPAGGGADLDTYIKNLLSMPAPGGVVENQGGASPPPPGESVYALSYWGRRHAFMKIVASVSLCLSLYLCISVYPLSALSTFSCLSDALNRDRGCL